MKTKRTFTPAIPFLTLVALLCWGAMAFGQGVSISPSSSTPHSSAGLDIDFPNKGLLIPRVALVSATDATTIPSPQKSLVVFNTGTGGLAPAGFYYNGGTTGTPKWVAFLTDDAASPAAWSLKGNTGTTAGTDFIGTADNKDLVVKTNNTERIRILAGGNVGIGVSPTQPLHVKGNILAANGANSTGTVRNAGVYVWDDRAYGMELNNNGTSWGLGVFARTDSDIRLGHYAANATAQNTLNTKLTVKNTGNVGIGTDAPRGKLHVEGDLVTSSSNGTVRQWSSAISSTQSGLIKMGELTLTASSQNLFISGRVYGQTGATSGESEFSMVIRSNTFPSKDIKFWQTQTNAGRLITLKVYEETSSGKIVVGFQTNGTIQTFGWDITFFERGDYNFWQNENAYVALNTAGLTEVAQVANHMILNPGGSVIVSGLEGTGTRPVYVSDNGALTTSPATAQWQFVNGDYFRTGTDGWTVSSGGFLGRTFVSANWVLNNYSGQNNSTHRLQQFLKSFDLSGIPHTEVKVKFAYYFIDTWDGGNTTDRAYLGAGSNGVTYPIVWQRKHHQDRGSGNIIGLSDRWDHWTTEEVTFLHSDNTLYLRFYSGLDSNPNDESFGFSNVEVWVR